MDRGTLAGVGDLMQIHLQPIGKRGDMGRRLLTQRRQIVLETLRHTGWTVTLPEAWPVR